MSNDDWYRNETWDRHTEEAFFAKLARARSQRDQYLVIQAIHLSTSSPEAALKLIDYYFETRSNKFHDVRAYQAKGDALRSLGDYENAVAAYFDVLELEEANPNQLTTTSVDLPYFIATYNLTSHFQAAEDLLGRPGGDISFPLDKFKLHAARSILADAKGDSTEAHRQAEMAIDAANIRKSGFRYHQDVGLVGKEHDRVIKLMYKLGAQ